MDNVQFLTLMITMGILAIGCFALVGASALANPVARKAIFQKRIACGGDGCPGCTCCRTTSGDSEKKK